MKRLALDGFSSPARLKVLSELGGLWSLLQLLTFLGKVSFFPGRGWG